MRVGILSDSHHDDAIVRRALVLLDERGTDFLIHCGDVGGMAVFDRLAGRACRFVWGNCDAPDAALERYVLGLGLTPPNGVPLRLTLGDKTFAVFHGHEPGFHVAARHPRVDYLLHGHTHQRRDERVGSTRIINPGALHRARPKTVATLDTQTDELVFHLLTDR